MALEVLRNDNYASWSACIRNYLLAHDLQDIVEATTEPPQPEDDIIQHEDWRLKNDAALDAIHSLCELDILAQVRGIGSAKTVWDTLAKLYGQLPQVVDPVSGLGDSANVSVSKEVTPMLSGAIQLVEEGNPSNVTGLGNSANVSESKEVTPIPTGVIQQVEEGNTSNCPGRDHYKYNGNVTYKVLIKAVQSGNWKAVQDFLELHPEGTSVVLTAFHETILHIAVSAGKTSIVEEFVKMMSSEFLAVQDLEGFTALTTAAGLGNYRMAKCMVEKNPKLVSIPYFSNGAIPVVRALDYGNEEVASYLYIHTPIQDLEPGKWFNGASVMSYAIVNGAFEIALDLISRYPRLAFARDMDTHTPITRLALTPKAFWSGDRLVFWKRWIYIYCIHIRVAGGTNECRLNIKNDRERAPVHQLASNCIKFLGFRQLYEKKLRHVQCHQLLSCMCKEISYLDEQERKDGLIYEGIFRAIKSGIFEFVYEAVRTNPELLTYIRDSNQNSIFMVAVQYRQAEIFSLIYPRFEQRKGLVSGRDIITGNSILHMAGTLTTSTPLYHISGAALQMQRELQWFKEVERVVPPLVKYGLNKEGLTPRELFIRDHEDLRRNGEEWMKNTATSCTVVGALIATMMFAAAFTVPGGNNQEGLPVFLSKKLFALFIVSDALSLFSSSASVLMFLGILTSRYAQEDFLKSLPKRMIIGLFTLFFSIATMMIAFCSTLSLMLPGRPWIVPVICLAGVPITLFVLMQFPLLVDMLISTFGPGIFNKRIKF